jgi:excisionase family DNA binding protein
MTETTQDRLLTAAEVCELLSIGRTRFYELVNSGELQAVTLPPRPGTKRAKGGKRVALSEIQDFIKRNAAAS